MQLLKLPVSPIPHSPPRRALRSEAPDARERLLLAGLRLFAEQGFARTSTRELAEAAQVNVAAINYYFGDKQGLYRAAFIEPFDAHSPPGFAPGPKGWPVEPPVQANHPGAPLRDVVQQQVDELLMPLHGGERVRWCLQLHFREMVEPTGLWAEEIEHGIKPSHLRLLRALYHHFGQGFLPAEGPHDPDLARLALAIAGLGVYLHVGRDVISALEPALTPGPATADAWRDTLVRHAWAMIDAEHQRRARVIPGTTPAPVAAPAAAALADPVTAVPTHSTAADPNLP